MPPAPLADPLPVAGVIAVSEPEEAAAEVTALPEPASEKPARAPEPVSARTAAKSLEEANTGARQRAAPGTFEDATLLNAFLNETDVDILARLDATSALDTNAISLHLPRVKFGGGAVPATGEGEQIVTLPFQALLPTAPAAGVANSTIRIHDTAAT